SLAAVSAHSGDEWVRRMTGAVLAFVGGLAQAAPLVMVFEDLHWSDEASLALLQSAWDLVPRYPLLLIGLLRPDRDAPAWGLAELARQKLPAGRADEIMLEPLSTTDSRSLLGLLL